MKVLDVDLMDFEKGDSVKRSAAIDGVLRSLATGFVYLKHDIPQIELDDCYARLSQFFRLPLESKQRTIVAGTRGQRGYTGLRVERAVGSKEADWKEMLKTFYEKFEKWLESADSSSVPATNDLEKLLGLFPDDFF